MTWGKRDSRWQCSPRLRAVERQHGHAAAVAATLAFDAVLGVHAEHGGDGRLEPIFADLGYVVTFCPLLTLEQLKDAVAHLVEVDLLGRDGEGLIIEGWDETWRTMKPSSERVRLHRARKAEKLRMAR